MRSIIYRLGTYIPLPGIDPDGVGTICSARPVGGVLELFNMFAGGAVGRLAIFALNIMPYISASIIVQLLTSVVPSFEALKKEGEQGRKIINQYTRYLTVVLAVFQAWRHRRRPAGLREAWSLEPGLFFQISTVITLVGGTMFLMRLGEQITARGIGNGSSLIIFAGIVARLPVAAIVSTLELGRQGALIDRPDHLRDHHGTSASSPSSSFMERAQRRLLITYPKRQVGNRMYEGQTSFLPLKLNTAGVIPPIFASSLLLLPTTIGELPAGRAAPGCADDQRPISPMAGRSTWCYIGADRLLRLLLHRGRVQPGRDGGQSEEARRLHAGHPPGERTAQVYRPEC